jgi:hypothetical protein
MATWVPISGTAIQYAKNAGGAAAADYYLKFYAAGTTTAISMATTSSGVTTLDKCKVDSNGWAVNGSDDPFIPHIDRDYKLVLYTNATDADADATGSAAWVIDNLPADGVDKSYTSVASLRDSTGNDTFNVIEIDSYHEVTYPSTAGPKGGHKRHRTGGTNTAPTVGSPVAVSTIGIGTQAGYVWDGDGAEWLISDDFIVPEKFGNDPSGTTASGLTNVIAFCKAQNKMLHGTDGATYLINEIVDFDDIVFDLEKSTIKFDTNISTVVDQIIVTTGDGAAIGSEDTRHCSITIDANRDNQTVNLTAFNIRNDDSALSSYSINLNEFRGGVLVDGNTERTDIIVRGADGGTLYTEQAFDGSTPDDNKVTLYGAACEKWYKGSGQVSSYIDFHVENNVDVGDWAVEVLTGKVVTLGGAIRGINGNGVRYNDEGSTGTVVQDDLSIIQVRGGVAVEMQEMQTVTGNLYVENFDGDGVVIDSVQDTGGCYVSVKDNQGGGTPLKFEHLGYSGLWEESVFHCSLLAGPNASGYCLEINNGQNGSIYVDKINGNILAGSGCARVICYVDSGFVNDSRSATNNASSDRFGLVVRGQSNQTEVLTEVSAWAFNGVVIEQVFASGDYSRYEWDDTGWKSSKTLAVSQSRLVDATENVNLYYKVPGNMIFDSTNSQLVTCLGTAATAPWYNLLTGAVAYTPA